MFIFPPKQVVNTMYNRAKYHPHQTDNMKEAMKIFSIWLKKHKPQLIVTNIRKLGLLYVVVIISLTNVSLIIDTASFLLIVLI